MPSITTDLGGEDVALSLATSLSLSLFTMTAVPATLTGRCVSQPTAAARQVVVDAIAARFEDDLSCKYCARQTPEKHPPASVLSKH